MIIILAMTEKSTVKINRILFCVLFVLTIGFQTRTIQAEHLTIERITSLHSLIGTAPINPVWSPDSNYLSFLWNDKAMPFRDIWIISANNNKPIKITDMAGEFTYPEIRLSNYYESMIQKAISSAQVGVTEVTWKPDGKVLIFIYQGDLFQVHADGTNLQRLTNTKTSKYALAFSPDSKFLSYIQEGDLCLWNMEKNKLIQATHMAKPPIGIVPGSRYTRLDAEFTSYKWSPDSKHIALQFYDRRNIRKLLFPNYLTEETTVRELRRDYPSDKDFIREMGIYCLEKESLSMIELKGKRERHTSNYSWSPDGSQLLIDQNTTNNPHRLIYVVDAEDCSIQEIWRDKRELQICTFPWNSEWQSNGEGILFLSDMDGYVHLYVLLLKDPIPKQLTKGNWSIISKMGLSPASLTVSSNTKEVYFVSTKKNPYERQVYKIAETGGAVTQVTSLPGCHTPIVSPDGLKIALLHSNDTTPTELYITESKGKSSERRITHSPQMEFYNYNWIKPQYVSFKSHIDDVILHGRLLLPPNLDKSKKYPVILGPVYFDTVRNQWHETYGTIQQYLVLEGQYIVFQIDSRGSSGYGSEFRHKFQYQCGIIDIEDLYSGVNYLKTLPFVDPERIGIWGSSYGGLLTVMSLFKKPGVYKAGVAGAPTTNAWHATNNEVRLFGNPDSCPETYHQGSAFCYGENLQDHLMIIHGMQDSVIQFRDSVALTEKLMMLGKDFDFVVAPSATHKWLREDYVATYLLKKLVGHFDRYIGRGSR